MTRIFFTVFVPRGTENRRVRHIVVVCTYVSTKERACAERLLIVQYYPYVYEKKSTEEKKTREKEKEKKKKK